MNEIIDGDGDVWVQSPNGFYALKGDNPDSASRTRGEIESRWGLQAENVSDVSKLKVGDRIKLTIEGTLRELSDLAFCHEIETDGENGAFHYVFLGGPEGFPKLTNGLTVEIIEPAYQVGKAYQDADGEVFLRRDDPSCPWMDAEGESWASDFPNGPLILLVPER